MPRKRRQTPYLALNLPNRNSPTWLTSPRPTPAYDAFGIRVKAVAPNGAVTDYPFPGYEVESPTSNPTVRLTFSIAGQAVALRVQVVGGSNTLYYLHSDHLGSTSLATTTGVNIGS